MKRKTWVIAYAVLGLAAVGLLALLVRQMVPPATAADLNPSHAAIADAFLDRLDAGEFAAAHAMLAPVAAEAIALAQLEQIWTSLPTQLGERRSRSALRGEHVEGRDISTTTLVFEKVSLDVRIAVDGEGRIDGFRALPTSAPPAGPPPASISEGELVIGEPALPATLSLPSGSGPFPAVVLVHGSGPHDRDQTIGPNRVFRTLAHGLNDHGIAVLRYEKRTHAHPQQFADGDFTVDKETVDDAVLAVALLQQQPQIDPAKVFVAGHSLGAMMAPRIAQRAEGVAGLVMIATPARSLHDIVVQQVAYLADLDGERSAEEAASIAEIGAAAERVRQLDAATEIDGPLLLGLPEAYWRDLLAYDAVATAATLSQPLLILHGGRDYQVIDEDFARWQARFDGDPRVTLKQYPALNHLFAAGEGPSGPEEYFGTATFDAQPIADIAEWIHGR